MAWRPNDYVVEGIRLEEWNGVSCYDCGREMDREDRYTCVECSNDFCDYCVRTVCQKLT